MHTNDVVVIGTGPTGLMLANERALAGADVSVLERRTDEPNITRAFAVHARTLELLDARGTLDLGRELSTGAPPRGKLSAAIAQWCTAQPASRQTTR